MAGGVGLTALFITSESELEAVLATAPGHPSDARSRPT